MTEDPLNMFLKIQAMVRKESEDAARRVYAELGPKFGVADVPNHIHNGIDTSQINAVNVVQNIKYVSGLIIDTSETVTFTGLNLVNPARLALFAFAANNADASPATKRAIINGEAQFGRLYAFTGAGSGSVTLETTKIGDPFQQICNSMYIDSTDLTKGRVAIGTQLARVVDDTGSPVVEVTIDSFTYNSITITSVMATNWKLQGNLYVL